MTASVVLAGGVATVTISKAGGVSAAVMQSIVDGLAYDNTSDNPGAATRVVTLTSLSDTGPTGGANDNINGLGTTTAKGAYCAAFAASHGGQAAVGNQVGNYTCNPDFNVSQLGAVTRWTPVKNLTFSAEVQWFHLDQKMSGSSVFTASAPKPNALYEFKDQDTFLLQVRAQRNF